jgi:hypothetical protein
MLRNGVLLETVFLPNRRNLSPSTEKSKILKQKMRQKEMKIKIEKHHQPQSRLLSKYQLCFTFLRFFEECDINIKKKANNQH